MSHTATDYRTLADGSIDYAHYDRHARAIRSGDARKACRLAATALFLSWPRSMVRLARGACSAALSVVISPGRYAPHTP
jgi:hypothetical protein